MHSIPLTNDGLRLMSTGEDRKENTIGMFIFVIASTMLTGLYVIIDALEGGRQLTAEFFAVLDGIFSSNRSSGCCPSGKKEGLELRKNVEPRGIRTLLSQRRADGGRSGSDCPSFLFQGLDLFLLFRIQRAGNQS